MKNLGCPAHIKFLLHCHCIPGPYPEVGRPLYQDLIKELLSAAVIVEEAIPGNYTTTELGKAWVEALCNVPPPRTVFVDEQGRELSGK